MNDKSLLNFILFVSILFVISFDFFVVDYLTCFPSLKKFGNTISNISMAYISSYVFYWVATIYKERLDRKNIYSTIYRVSKRLVSAGYKIANELARANNCKEKDFEKKVSKEMFFDLCKKTNPKSQGVSDFVINFYPNIPRNYAQIIYYYAFLQTKEYIATIFTYMPFLDSQFIKILNKINESEFYLVADTLLRDTKNTTFEAWADSFYKFHLLMAELDSYIEANYKIYVK